ncbi:hypothetical protein ABT034_16110 [Streptomyces sp. NPDC002773]|uniref:hypothetical protein n=1 Tax=Streptomyces sp. NPDC002773 TaxID=3154430 RepID=UPI00331EDD25
MPHPSPTTPPPDRRPGAPAPHGAPDLSDPSGPPTAPEVLDAADASAKGDASVAPADSDASVAAAGPDVSVAPADSESGWSPRLGRLGAPRPVPNVPRARWFGVPLVPLLVGALVAGAFLAARGGTEQGLATEGRQGVDRVGVPSPAGEGGAATLSADGEGTDTHGGADGGPDTRADGTPTAGTPKGDTPTDDTATPDVTVSGAPAPTEPADPTTRPSTGPDGTVTGVSPTPSRTGKAVPTPRPTATATHGGSPARPVSFEALRVGDCFDIDRDAPGTALRRSCDTPHNAELVVRLRLTGVHATDLAVREAATLLCREPLRRKAALQPLGTRWTTFVQYPYRTSYLLGSDTVACSLAAPSATGGKLSRPLL